MKELVRLKAQSRNGGCILELVQASAIAGSYHGIFQQSIHFEDSSGVFAVERKTAYLHLTSLWYLGKATLGLGGDH